MGTYHRLWIVEQFESIFNDKWSRYDVCTIHCKVFYYYKFSIEMKTKCENNSRGGYTTEICIAKKINSITVSFIICWNDVHVAIIQINWQTPFVLYHSARINRGEGTRVLRSVYCVEKCIAKNFNRRSHNKNQLADTFRF